MIDTFNIEISALSTFFIDYMQYKSNMDRVHIDLFSDQLNREIFNAIKIIFSNKNIIDEHLVLNFLKKNSHVDELTLERRLIEILASNSMADVAYYLDELEEALNVRMIRQVVTNISYKDNSDIIKRDLEKLLNNDVLKKIETKGISSINSIQPQTLEEIAEDIYFLDFLPIPKNEMSLLVGDGGSGKSMLALQLAIKASAKNIKTLLWFSEDGEQKIANRFHSICDEVLVNINKSVVDSNLKVYTRKDKVFSVVDEHMQPSIAFEKFKREVENYDLIIIDPLLAFTFNADENNNGQMRAALQPFVEWLGNNPSKTILFIHHSPTQELKSRGASAIRDTFRLIYLMEPFVEYIKNNNGEFHKDNRGKIRTKIIKSDRRKVIIDKDNHDISKFVKLFSKCFDVENNYLDIPIFSSNGEVVESGNNEDDFLFDLTITPKK